MHVSKSQFRGLVVLTTAVSVAGIASCWYGDAMLPNALQIYTHTRADSFVPSGLLVALALVTAVVEVVALAGLLLFWKPARLLLLCLWIFGVLLAPLAGPTVETGWTTALDEFSNGLVGLLLGLCFLSPVKDLFEKTWSRAEQGADGA